MRRLAVAFVSFAITALFAAPALGQQPERARQPVGREAAVKAYRPASWPAPSPARVGVDPNLLGASGFTRLSLRVDARLGEALVRFSAAKPRARPEDPPSPRGRGALRPVAWVRLRVHEDAQAARASLLERLAAVQSRLSREEGIGDVAFGGRTKGLLGYALGVVGNVSYVVHALEPVDIAPLAAATARLISAAAPLTRSQTSPAPRLLSCQAEAVVGQPARLRLDFDPGAATATHLAFRCSEGAGVLQTKDGYELWAARPGAVTVQVFACSKTLRVERSTHRIRVLSGSDR